MNTTSAAIGAMYLVFRLEGKEKSALFILEE